MTKLAKFILKHIQNKNFKYCHNSVDCQTIEADLKCRECMLYLACHNHYPEGEEVKKEEASALKEIREKYPEYVI